MLNRSFLPKIIIAELMGIGATDQLQQTFSKPAGTDGVRDIHGIWRLRK